MPTYIQREVLGQLPDVFHAEALWRAPGLALFQRRPLLRDLLERSPREQRTQTQHQAQKPTASTQRDHSAPNGMRPTQPRRRDCSNPRHRCRSRSGEFSPINGSTTGAQR